MAHEGKGNFIKEKISQTEERNYIIRKGESGIVKQKIHYESGIVKRKI